MPLPRSSPQRGKQRGLALIELTIAMGITAILAVFAAQRYQVEIDEGVSQAAGAYGLSVKGALDLYLTENASALIAGTAVSGYASALAPTITELKANGKLPSSFPVLDPWRRRYIVSINRTNCPGSACSLAALAYTNTPLTDRCTANASDGACSTTQGQARAGLIETIKANAGGFGATVSPLASTRFRGNSCDYPRPSAATVGTYGVCTTQTAAIYAQFVRINDTRDPDLRGTLTIAGKVTAKSNLSVSGNVDANGVSRSAAFVPNKQYTIGSVCSEAMAISKASSSELAICQGGLWRSMLKINVEGGSCPTNGAVAKAASGVTTSQEGTNLVCINNKYVSFSRILSAERPGATCTTYGATAYDASASMAAMNTLLICRANPLDSTATKIWYRINDLISNIQYVGAYTVTQGTVIRRPSCPVPAGMTSRSITQFIPNVQSSGDGGTVVRADETTTTWTARFYAGNGALQLGTPSAIAQIYCYYY